MRFPGLLSLRIAVAVLTKDSSQNGASVPIPARWKGKDRVLVVDPSHLLDLVKSNSVDTCSVHLGEDTRARKSVLLLKDEATGLRGLIPQLGVSGGYFG